MSSITSSIVLLLHLCSSFHYECINARSLGVFYDEPSNKYDQYSSSDHKKNHEMKLSDPARVFVQPEHLRSGSSTPNGSLSSKDMLDKEKIQGKINESKKHVEAKGVPRKSESSIDWKVPDHHKKKEDDQQVPGFNMDYLPPKTHPPVHN